MELHGSEVHAICLNRPLGGGKVGLGCWGCFLIVCVLHCVFIFFAKSVFFIYVFIFLEAWIFLVILMFCLFEFFFRRVGH